MHEENKNSEQPNSDDNLQNSWVEAVENMAADPALRERVALMERQLFLNSYQEWPTH